MPSAIKGTWQESSPNAPTSPGIPERIPAPPRAISSLSSHRGASSTCSSASTVSPPPSPTHREASSSLPRNACRISSTRSSSPTRSGLDVFGIGEHHRAEFLDSAPVVILAAAAARTKKHSPDQRRHRSQRRRSRPRLSGIRHPGSHLQRPRRDRRRTRLVRRVVPALRPAISKTTTSLFAEKLELLLNIRDEHERQLVRQTSARPYGPGCITRARSKIRCPSGSESAARPQSFVRAGMLGLPLMVAIIGGEPRRFRPLIDLYREAGRRAGHPPRATESRHCTRSASSPTPRSRPPTIFSPATPHTFTEIGKERGWPPTTRAQFRRANAALPAPCSSVIPRRRRKNSLHQRRPGRHLPHHFPDVRLHAGPLQNAPRHRTPRHQSLARGPRPRGVASSGCATPTPPRRVVRRVSTCPSHLDNQE